jgi:cellulose synthase/poly-beta-1,6-N-acetylglucosamine synthase-like glycosyltransferase
MIDQIALLFGFMHFAAPLVYYAYVSKRLNDPWGFPLSESYQPRISLIIPTYLEADLIHERLDNILAQDYPLELMEVLVVDSASPDETREKVREWMEAHPGYNIKLILEDERKGKAHALNRAMRHIDASSQVMVTTDVDCAWDTNALKDALKYFSAPTVGAVTCVKMPKTMGSERSRKSEKTYRDYNSVVRVAESKIHSTPIFHGEFAAYRLSALEKISGFREDIGADDSHTATLIALAGYRSICVPDAEVVELVPSSFRMFLNWKTRRAQHLVQHFIKVGRMEKTPKCLASVINLEEYLHVFNPWLFLVALIALLLSFCSQGLTLINNAIIVGLALVIFYPPYRDPFMTWSINQFFLIAAMIKNILIGPDVIWTKARDEIPPPEE